MAIVSICFMVVICSLLQQGLSITCYQCSSYNDTRCLLPDNLPQSFKQQCKPTHNLCRKITQELEIKLEGMPSDDNRVIRECGYDDSKFLNSCYRPSGFGSRQEVCSCLVDGCNSASIPVAGTTLLFLTFALLKF